MSYELIKSVLLYITKNCNLQCKHCYVTSFKSGHTFSLEDLKRVNEIVCALNKPLDITGGDPFVYKHLEAYLDSCFDMGIEVSSIFTNGTLLTTNEPLLRYIYSKSKNTLFFVSLDGYQDSHNAFRGQGSFQRALDGARLLKEIGFKVNINTILHNRISTQDLVQLYVEIKSRMFDRWRVDTPFNAGNWEESKVDFDLNFDGAFECFNQILSMWLRGGKPFEIELDHVLKFVDDQFHYLDEYSMDSPICPCRTLPIWPNGDITWCQDLYGEDFIIGNIYDDVDSIYENYRPYKQRTIADMVQCVPQCASCDYISYCGVGCRANSILLSGEYFEKDKELCYLFESGLYKTIAQTLIEYQQKTNKT